MTLQAERSRTGQIPYAASKVCQTATFVQPLMLKDKLRLSFETFLLMIEFVEALDAVKYFTTISNYFSDDVALKGIALSEGVVSAGFRLVFQRPKIHSFPYIERLTIGAAEDVDVKSTVA